VSTDHVPMTAEDLEALRSELIELEGPQRREIAARLRDQVQHAVVVELAKDSQTVAFGNQVAFTDKAGREQRFRIVSARQAKPAEGLLSVASPIANALLGHRVGDVVRVSAPSGVRELVIDEIS
jgi:transcription elongation factor GreA